MLASIPVAANAGMLGQRRPTLVAPWMLSRNGQAITLSTGLLKKVAHHPAALKTQATTARASGTPLAFVSTHRFGNHALWLRYWLAAAGIHPDRDVRLIAIPPPLMVESLRAGQIDGFCVGAPWNGLAEAAGLGEIVATKSEIFPHGIEKVLAMPSRLLEDEAVCASLLRAVAAAARWCDDPANHVNLAELLARPSFLGTDPEQSLRALRGHINVRSGRPDADYLYFSRFDANRPRRQEALWLYAQMRRWGQVKSGTPAIARAMEAEAAAAFRPDFHARVFGGAVDTERPIPACDRVEFDGVSVDSYLQLFELATPFGADHRSL